MKRVLLVMATEEMSNNLQNTLRKNYIVTACTGAQIHTELLHNHFDALIIDLFLPGTDGLTLLANFPGTLPPVILALSRLYSDYILYALNELGVDYLLRIPCPIREIERRLSDMFLKLNPPGNGKQTAQLLFILGIGHDLDGHRYLSFLLPRYARDRRRNLSGDLYLKTARAYKTSEENVKAAIRYAIIKAWRHRDDKVWQDYFPDTASCPSNKQFIATLAGHLN